MAHYYPDGLSDTDLSDFRWELHPSLYNSSGMNNSTLLSANSSKSAFDDDNVIHRPYIKGLICALYCVIFVCGIFGNGLVAFVVIRNKAMHTVTNFFICSLAMNDIVICALTVPLTPLYTFLEGWYFGSFMCHLFPLIQAASLFISTLTLTIVAVERFFVICYPHFRKLTTTMALCIIFFIWLLSFSVCVPYAVYMRYLPASLDGRGSPASRCDEEWPQYGRRLFGTMSLIVQYAIPLIVIMTSYVCIWLKLRAQAAKGLSNSSRKGRDSAALIRKRRTNRMLMLMVVIFGCCWLPLNLVNVLNDYFPQTITGWEYFVLVFFVGHILATSSTCYNPILYAWMNENFRKEFKSVLPCFTTPPPGERGRQSTFINDKSLYGDTERNGDGYYDSESTYMTNLSPKYGRKVMVVNGNSIKKLVPGEDAALLAKAGLLQVPSYATLKVEQPLEDEDADIHDV